MQQKIVIYVFADQSEDNTEIMRNYWSENCYTISNNVQNYRMYRISDNPAVTFNSIGQNSDTD